jgi:hypothetical protein
MRGITTTSGLKPQGAPFVTWSSIGGANGTIVMSDSKTNSLFVNQALGEGPWRVVSTIAGRAYGREVRAGMLHPPMMLNGIDLFQCPIKELSGLPVVRQTRVRPKTFLLRM